uniref:C2H2-type domain-containing protein n=1 Tax=Peronospora matthiolae TaxID=2874970 RepID=A0AAV1V456_9STRA
MSSIRSIIHTPPAISTPRESVSPHGRERPFHCPVPSCHGRFQRKFTLREHMKTHTGEKPYQCSILSCSKRFSTSGNLARHRRLHLLKKLECPVVGCTRIFTKAEKLARHLQNHLGSVAHVCVVDSCNKTFSTAGNLTRHLRTQHPPGAVAAARAATLPQLRIASIRPGQVLATEYAAWSSDAATSPTASTTSATSGREQNLSATEAANVSDHEILDVLQCLFVDDMAAAAAGQAEDHYNHHHHQQQHYHHHEHQPQGGPYRLQSDQPVLIYL